MPTVRLKTSGSETAPAKMFNNKKITMLQGFFGAFLKIGENDQPFSRPSKSGYKIQKNEIIISSVEKNQQVLLKNKI